MILERGDHAHSFFGESLNQTLTQTRKINSCKFLSLVRQDVIAGLGPSSGCLSPEASRSSFPSSSQRLREKRRGAGRQEKSSSFIYRMTEADFMVVGWWLFSWLPDDLFPFPVLGKGICSWGVTRFHQHSKLRVEATDQAVKSLFPAQGFMFMAFCILLKPTGREALRLIHLPATSTVAENSPPETPVHKFSVNLSASLSPVIPGLPLIINTSPLTDGFRVNWLSGIDFEASPSPCELFTEGVPEDEGGWDSRSVTISSPFPGPLTPLVRPRRPIWGIREPSVREAPKHFGPSFST